MNRRMRLATAALCMAVLVGSAVFTQKRDDGLDWIRRYDPIEQVRGGSPGDFGTGLFSTRWHIFKFNELPAEFEQELRGRTEYRAVGDSYHFNGTFPDTDRIMVDRDTGTVEVWMREKEDWLEVNHRELRWKLCLR